MLSDDRLAFSDFGVRSKTKVEIALINNLRNILGPHHLEIGESYFVCPSTFFKEPSVWTTNPEKWNDGYCFVVTGF